MIVVTMLFTSIGATIGGALYIGEKAVSVSNSIVVLETKVSILTDKIEAHLAGKK